MIDQATSHKDAIRPAVTVLVLRDNPLRVLMVKRHPGAFLGSSLTFPGGVVETQDGSPDWLAHVTGAAVLDPEERARRIAACRETFEESGVLLTAPKARPQPGAGDFLQQVSACGARLALGRLQPFAHWITPRGIPKRFDTRFYLCRASPNQTALCDGAETVELEWIAPAEALAHARAGTRSIPFPTRMNLKRLAESDCSNHAFAAARLRAYFVTMPEVLQTEHGTRVRIPHEAGYGVTEDAL